MTGPAPTVLSLGGHTPQVPEDAFVAPGATLVGDVHLGARSSIWYAAVVRADRERITVGERSNVQDGSVLHADPGWAVVIGDGVTIGHGAIVHGCTIGDGSLVGMRAVVLNGAVVGRDCLVAAGAVVLGGTEVPDRSLVAGIPARVVRALGDDELALVRRGEETYLALAREHAAAVAAVAAEPAVEPAVVPATEPAVTTEPAVEPAEPGVEPAVATEQAVEPAVATEPAVEPAEPGVEPAVEPRDHDRGTG